VIWYFYSRMTFVVLLTTIIQLLNVLKTAELYSAKYIKSFESWTSLYPQETFHLRSRFHRTVSTDYSISITSTIEAYTIAMHYSDPVSKTWFAEYSFETRPIRFQFLSASKRSKNDIEQPRYSICSYIVYSHCSKSRISLHDNGI